MNRKEYRERQERDCFNCVHKHPDGNCGSWDCEYINRREAIEAWRAMKGEQIEPLPEQECEKCIFKPFKQFQPERKKGKWIDTKATPFTNNEGQLIHEKMCSKCKSIAYFRSVCGSMIANNVCPNCGAEMEGADE